MSEPTPESTAVRSLLADAFGRVAQEIASLADGLSDDTVTWRPDAGSNSIAWLLWHLTRVQDDHIADLAQRPQVWTSQGFQERFALPFDADATGYGQSSEEVAQVRVQAADLAAYHAAVDQETSRYLDGLTLEELERVVDTRWDPPVTAAVRLVSVVNDCMEHVGQAAYVKGMAERAHGG
jgi:uncharacterized damage-inducible protein DinB